MGEKIKFLDVIQNNVEASQYGVDGYFHYLYITNLTAVEDTSNVLKIVCGESVSVIDNITKTLIIPSDNTNSDTPEHTEESLGLCSVMAIEIDKKSIEEAIPRLSIEMSIVDDNIPVYALFYVDTVDSEYMPIGIKPNLEVNEISAVYFSKKNDVDYSRISISTKNPSLSSEEFKNHIAAVHRCNPQIERKAFVTVYDEKSIDSMIASTIYRFSLGSDKNTMMSLSEYNAVKQDDSRKAIIILGIDSNILDYKQYENITIVHPYSYGGVYKTITNEISSFMESFIMSDNPNTVIPATVKYIDMALESLTDINVARYDTIIMSLYSALSFNGHVGFMTMIDKFLTGLHNVDSSILGKYLADSLGVHYSNAVRKTDSIFHSIQTVDNNIINNQSGDISIFTMHASEHEIEAMLEYVRNTKTGGRYILVNEKINSETKNIEYKFIAVDYNDTLREEVMAILENNILKNINIDTIFHSTQYINTYPASYPFFIYRDDMVDDNGISVYSLDVSLSSIFSVL